MEANKLSQVADCIYEAIPISAFEKRVISTTIFNRLHNVLQNSTVYFTYPCNRTSRFSHSLGCMHLAGELFKNGIVNALTTNAKTFFTDVKKEIELVKKNQSSFIDKHLFADASKGTESDCLERFDDPFYLKAIPGKLTEPPDKMAFVVIYQALRLVALLHDVGHPPFSHVTEQAMGTLKDYLDSIKSKKTSRQKHTLRIFKSYLAKSKAFHEELGKKLAEELLTDIETHTKANPYDQYHAFIFKHLVLKILDGKSPLFKALHDIVDSPLDADRLDYVSRDLYMSGVTRAPLAYNRLIASYKLHYGSVSLTQKAVPEFLHSVRAISTIEEFYSQRLVLYKYVIYHHRVVKFDGLLREVIVGLAKEWLKQERSYEPLDPKLDNNLLPIDISGLWKILDPKITRLPRLIVNYYNQWDDFWLLTVLRNHFFKEDATQNKTLHIKLGEILSNRKLYYTLYKRVDSFLPVDSAFVEQAIKDFSESPLIALIPAGTKLEEASLRTAIRDLANYLEKYKIKQESDSAMSDESVNQKQGFFLTRLVNLLTMLGISMDWIFKAAESMKAEFGIDDIFVTLKALRPGLSSEMHLTSDEGTIQLANVSGIAEKLRQDANLFPPFFIFYFQEGKSSFELNKLKSSLGRRLFEEYAIQLRERISNE